jgi:hypothetical protein
VIFSVLIAIAMAVGTYIAFAAVLRFYDVEYSELAKNVGKLTAVFARNLQQKAAAVKSGIGSLTNPTATLASLADEAKTATATATAATSIANPLRKP